MKIKKTLFMAIAAAVSTCAFAIADTSAAPMPVTSIGGITEPIIIRREIDGSYGTIVGDFVITFLYDESNPMELETAPIEFKLNYDNRIGKNTQVIADTLPKLGDMIDLTPGDYVVHVTETSTPFPAVFPVDTVNKYDYIMSVRNNATMDGYELFFAITDKDGNKLENVSDDNTQLVFRSTANLTNATINVRAEGNAADTNKCFAYSVGFSQLLVDSYTFKTSSTCANNPATVKSGSVVYLRHGDSATIGLDGTFSQIPVSAELSILRANDDYKTIIDGVEQKSTTKMMVALNDADFNRNNVTNIVERLTSSAVNTGVAIEISIFIALFAAAVAGICVFAKGRSSN